MASGFAGSSIDAVARAAGVSKKTLYRLVPTKADLFRASIIDRIEGFMLAIEADGLDEPDAEEGLARLLRAFGESAAPTADDIAQRAEACARLFTHGCGSRR